MDIDIHERAPEQKAGVPAESYCTQDEVRRIFESYKQENDAARITAKPEPIPNTIETFTIGLADVKGGSATLNFLWDKTRVPVKVGLGA